MGNNQVANGCLFPRGFSTATHFPWPLVRAEELVVLNYGKALCEGDRRPGDIRVYGTNGQCGWHDMRMQEGPGVILGRKGQGPLGVEWCDDDYWVIDTAYFITPKTNTLDLKYFYYLVKYIGLNHLKDGTSNPSLSRDTFNSLLLPFPPISAQLAIVQVLGTLDDKIELNRRINETLEAMARAIFKSWFVDFDPVRAKADGRPTGLPKPIADLFPNRFEDSELGKTPKGWRVGPLTEIATLHTTTVHPAERPEMLWEHYSIPAFDEGRQPKWERGETIKSGKFAVPKNCVLASKLNPQFPRVWLPDVRDSSVAVCSTEFMPFVPVVATWRPFLFQLANSEPFQGEIISRVTGSTGSRQRVQPQQIASVPVVVPPQEVIQAFSTRVGPLQERQAASIREASMLTALRDALLPRLLSGEILGSGADK